MISVPVTLNIGICPFPAPVNLEGFEYTPNIAHLSWDVPALPGDLLGYNVYRDGEMINPAIIATLFYDDTLISPDQYLYYVTAVYPECESASDTVSLLITKINHINNTGITILPNPATDIVYISLNGVDYTEATVVVYDIDGRAVINEVFNGQAELNVSSLEAGIYFVKVNTATMNEIRKLVIR